MIGLIRVTGGGTPGGRPIWYRQRKGLLSARGDGLRLGGRYWEMIYLGR